VHRLADLRSGKCFPGERRALLYAHFGEFEIELAIARRSKVEEVDYVRAQERLRDAMSRECIRRDNDVGAAFAKMLLGVLLTGASNDLELRIQAAGGQDDVEIDSVRRGRGNQPGSAFDLGLAKCGLLRRVAAQDQP